MTTGMDPVKLNPQRAMERILHADRASLRKIRWATILNYSAGRADVELLERDVYRGPDKQPKPQRITLRSLPVRCLSLGGVVIGMTPKKGDEVLVFCSDRSVAPFASESEAKPAEVTDLKLHGFNGAFVVPFGISEAALFEGEDPDVLVLGSKDSSCRLEINTGNGEIEAIANLIKLGGDAHPVANADQVDQTFGIHATKIDAMGSILGLPPLPPSGSTALGKVKGA